jgi:endo-1,4-beta-xylanase
MGLARILVLGVCALASACGPPPLNHDDAPDATPTEDAAVDGVVTPPDAAGCGGDPASIRARYAPYFSVGVAIVPLDLDESDLMRHQFSRLTAGNAMKFGPIHPTQDGYSFNDADAIANLARANCMTMTGHALVWHQQYPSWLFAGLTPGAPETIETLKTRLREHIETLVNRYGDVVDNWDVVNEAIDDGAATYRNSIWYQMFGNEEYIYWAFLYTRDALEAREPGSSVGKLYYNDYNVEVKVDKILAMLAWLEGEGIHVDGVGFQGHYQLGWPAASVVGATLDDIVGAGYDVKISELDMTIYDDYSSGTFDPEPEKPFTPVLESAQAARYQQLMSLFRARAANIHSVTIWGLSDDRTWLDDFPVPGRNDHPLLYDDDHQPKAAFDAMLAF